MAALGTALADISELVFSELTSCWVEILFMFFFAVGLKFALFPRKALFHQGTKGKKTEDQKSRQLHKQIAADVAAGNKTAALRTWHTTKNLAPASLETLKMLAQVVLETQPDILVAEMTEHFGAYSHTLGNAKSATAILDVVARAGRVDLLDNLAHEFEHKLLICPTIQTYEVLLGGHAAVGDEARVAQLCSEMHESSQQLSARGFALIIKGFLKNGMLDAALCQIQKMCQKGVSVPPFAVVQLFRIACQNGRSVEIFDAALKLQSAQLPQDACVVLLEDCQKRNDLAFALRVEGIARKGNKQLLAGAYDALLKICVAHADVHALELFKDMQKESLRISEGLCIGLLVRCADSKFLRFAEEIVSFVRARSRMTIPCYSAFMKVYAFCGMYDKACDLYAQIRVDGLEPDGLMYGCLMKFAVECGRTELSRELFDKSPALDIQNYMSLIRAAGRDKDVDRAFMVLERLKRSGVSIDIAAYNCVLDACVSVGDMKRAHAFISEMQAIIKLDIITYNTLLKGYCSKGDLQGAKSVLLQIEQAGLVPNDVSYNSLINAAVSKGNFREAWSTVEMMEHKGVPVDHYTICIMMKALKRVQDPKDVGRALELLDRSGIAVCSDEVLLNVVLETCTWHRQMHRLESIISAFINSKLRPSAHTYGSLIKACSTLKRLDKCHELWHLMVDHCALEPNAIVLGCMLDALVCNGKVEDAVALLNMWKNKVAPNTVMYSTIIKGFSSSRQADRALDMWKEMCGLGLAANIVVYNALIDSQARVGAMDAVSQLMESMEHNGCSPDNITYSTIVKGYCVKGDLDKAFEVFGHMQKNGMAVDSIVYNTIMDGCTRHNRMDMVDMVLEDMNNRKIKPSNFTLGILIKMYGRSHQLDKAFKTFEELPRRHGLHVNTQVRTCLMCACLSNQDFDRAMKVFEDMREAEGCADAKSHGSLLSGLVRNGKLEKAVALVEAAYGLGKTAKRGLPAGQVLEAETLEQLMRSLRQRQLMQSMGLPLLEKLRAAKVPISARLLTSSLQSDRRS